MAKIITIPNEDDPQMNEERRRLAPWARPNGWIYTGYETESDHIAQIRAVSAGAPLEVLDFVCHGTPTRFNDTFFVEEFGRSLSQIPRFSADTAIYLDACNTGLGASSSSSIAQVVANAAGCTVYGAKGYIKVGTTYAEGNEVCEAAPDGFAPYPGAQDATGRNVWIAFRPETNRERPQLQNVTFGMDADGRVWASFRPTAFRRTIMIESQSVNIRDDLGDATGLSALLNEIMDSAPVEFPPYRMAPDTTINYIHNGEVLIIDVYANGSLLRERISGNSWRVENVTQFQTNLQQNIR